MKLLIQGDRIAGTATDAYTGPMPFAAAPEDFNPDRMGEYRLVEGVWVIPPPQSVSRFQARMALRGAGLFDAVEAMMANPATPIAAVEAWQAAQEFRRQSPTILAMAQALNLTEQQLDDLFIAAGQIEA